MVDRIVPMARAALSVWLASVAESLNLGRGSRCHLK